MDKDLNQKQKSFIIQSYSPDDKWIVVFEDNGETGYIYFCSSKENGELDKIVDNLWIYNQINPPIEKCKKVFIIWSDDSNRAGLIIDGECWGILDLTSKRKLNAPRDKNMIVSIDMEVWNNGVLKNEGESLKLDNI